eukprot:6213085-Pleurochrysis_carterae.AAC.1
MGLRAILRSGNGSSPLCNCKTAELVHIIHGWTLLCKWSHPGPRSRGRFALCVGRASNWIAARAGSARRWRRRRIGFAELLGHEGSALRLVQFDVTPYLECLVVTEDLADRSQCEI